MIQERQLLLSAPVSVPVLTRDIWNTFIRFRKAGQVVSENSFTTLMWAAGDRWAVSRGLKTMDATRWSDFLTDRKVSRLEPSLSSFYRHELMVEYVAARLAKNYSKPEVVATVWGFLATIGITPPK